MIVFSLVALCLSTAFVPETLRVFTALKSPGLTRCRTPCCRRKSSPLSPTRTSWKKRRRSAIHGGGRGEVLSVEQEEDELRSPTTSSLEHAGQQISSVDRRKAAAAVLGWLGSMKLAWADALDDSLAAAREEKAAKVAASREATEAEKAATLATSGEGAATPSSVAATEEGPDGMTSVSPPPTSPASATFSFADGFPEDATVPYKGKELPLRKFRAKATVIVNIKNDDPEGIRQMPALAYLNTKYASKGLRILAFPTDQGWYEPEVAETVRVRCLQQYGFGQFPYSVVFDKVD